VLLTAAPLPALYMDSDRGEGQKAVTGPEGQAVFTRANVEMRRESLGRAEKQNRRFFNARGKLLGKAEPLGLRSSVIVLQVAGATEASDKRAVSQHLALGCLLSRTEREGWVSLCCRMCWGPGRPRPWSSAALR
jgi:hypothetical protein